MDYERLIEIIEKLNLGPHVVTGDDHIKIPCMFQETKHRDGYDRRASATISFGQRESWFTCFACGTKLPFHKALSNLAPYRMGDGVVEISQAVRAQELISGSASSAPEPRISPIFNTELAELLKFGLPQHAEDFLASKNIDPGFAVAEFKVCFMPKGYQSPNMDKPAFADCVYFPLLSRRAGRLICLGGHARPLESKLKYFSPLKGYYYGSLYGEHVSGRMLNKVIYLVEGPPDTIHVAQLGRHALGNLGVGFNGAKAALLASLHPKLVIVFLDGDDAGRLGAAKVLSGLSGRGFPVFNHCQALDPKHCDDDDLVAIEQSAFDSLS